MDLKYSKIWIINEIIGSYDDYDGNDDDDYNNNNTILLIFTHKERKLSKKLPRIFTEIMKYFTKYSSLAFENLSQFLL